MMSATHMGLCWAKVDRGTGQESSWPVAHIIRADLWVAYSRQSKITWWTVSSPFKHEQEGEDDFLILKRKSLSMQCPERKLQRNKGNLEEERINANSTEGKKRRVCFPVVAVAQVEFQSENTSERIILSLCVRRERPLGVAALRIDWEYLPPIIVRTPEATLKGQKVSVWPQFPAPSSVME